MAAVRGEWRVVTSTDIGMFVAGDMCHCGDNFLVTLTFTTSSREWIGVGHIIVCQ